MIIKLLLLLLMETANGVVSDPLEIRQFNLAVDLELSSETSSNASTGDLDGDGDLDIVLAKGRHWPLHTRNASVADLKFSAGAIW